MGRGCGGGETGSSGSSRAGDTPLRSKMGSSVSAAGALVAAPRFWVVPETVSEADDEDAVSESDDPEVSSPRGALSVGCGPSAAVTARERGATMMVAADAAAMGSAVMGAPTAGLNK
jgi:hypothetical protein